MRKFLCFSLPFAFLVLILYSTGFILFTLNALNPAPSTSTLKHVPLAIILTGGENRIAEGVSLLKEKHIQHVFISGVGKDTILKDILPEDYNRLDCCVSLGYQAQDTIGNATESYQWLSKNPDITSFYLVTSSYHMPRAYQIFKRHPKAQGYRIHPHAIPMERLSPEKREFWNLMFKEYNKLIYTWAKTHTL